MTTPEDRVAALFERLRKHLEAKLTAEGYSMVEDRHDPEAFGSRLVVFEVTDHAVRLSWDGREYFFVLEQCTFHEGERNRSWADVVVQHFDARQDDAQREAEVYEQLTGILPPHVRQ